MQSSKDRSNEAFADNLAEQPSGSGVYLENRPSANSFLIGDCRNGTISWFYLDIFCFSDVYDCI